MAKKEYVLELRKSDGAPIGRDEFSYRFGHTDVAMRVGRKGVSARASIEYKELPADLLEKDLFKDAVRKALAVYLMKNSEPLRIGSMVQRVDGEVLVHRLYRARMDSPASLLVTAPLVRPVHESFRQSAFAEKYLKRPKSKREHMDAALDALLVSKSKLMESERFMYLWVAFNGMIQSLPGGNERAHLASFHRLMKSGQDSLTTKTRPRPCQALIRSVKTCDVSCEEFLALADNVVKSDVDAAQAGLTPWGLAMVELGYFLRCRLFHANVPVLFAACASDLEICVLKNVNDLLEEFLDGNLVDWYLKESGEKNGA